MGQANKYWSGTQQARVFDDPKWVTAGWYRGSYSANRLRMLNGAFEIYFLLKKSIDACPDPDMRSLMTSELESAGDAGWGFGVCDLDDAFQHWLQAGPWTDNNTKSYMRANGIFGAQNPSIKGAQYCWGLATNMMDGGPTAAVNFFNALDSKLDDLSSAISSHNAEVANLANAINSKNGAKTRDALGTIASVAKKAKKLLFLAPKPNDTFLNDVYRGSPAGMLGGTSPNAHGSFTPFVDPKPGANRYSTTTVTGISAAGNFMTAVNDVDTFLKVHDGALRSGIFDNKTSTAFAALAVAVGKVPVLGSFYAEMVKQLPGFFASMKDLFEEHYRTIDRATRVN